MRRLVLLGLALPLLLVPGRTTLAPWTDPEPPSATSSLLSVDLEAPTLTCNEVETLGAFGIVLSTKAVLAWAPFTTPETNVPLTYTAQVLGTGLSLLSITDLGSTLTTEVTPALLGSLLGGPITVRVTGTLPQTAWTEHTDIVLTYSVLGVSVRCP